jgi:hypothetical protein
MLELELESRSRVRRVFLSTFGMFEVLCTVSKSIEKLKAKSQCSARE